MSINVKWTRNPYDSKIWPDNQKGKYDAQCFGHTNLKGQEWYIDLFGTNVVICKDHLQYGTLYCCE